MRMRKKEIMRKKTLVMFVSIFITALFLGTIISPVIADKPTLSSARDAVSEEKAAKVEAASAEPVVEEIEPEPEEVKEEPKEAFPYQPIPCPSFVRDSCQNG